MINMTRIDNKKVIDTIASIIKRKLSNNNLSNDLLSHFDVFCGGFGLYSWPCIVTKVYLNRGNNREENVIWVYVTKNINGSFSVCTYEIDCLGALKERHTVIKCKLTLLDAVRNACRYHKNLANSYLVPQIEECLL